MGKSSNEGLKINSAFIVHGTPVFVNPSSLKRNLLIVLNRVRNLNVKNAMRAV